MREALNPVLELIYPTYCGGCGRQGNVLCRACRDSFTAADSAVVCPLCGRWVGKPIACGECVEHPKPFDRGFYGFYFEGPLREAIHAFKFQGRKDVGRALVHMLEGRLQPLSPAFDVIVPLPLTEKRLRERGFNQSYVMGEEIARITGKPMDYGTLLKVRETVDQFTLSKSDRKKNVKGAFAVKDGRRIRGKSVLLIDDLYTTGSTAREACNVLLRSKVEKIVFFALARTP